MGVGCAQRGIDLTDIAVSYSEMFLDRGEELFLGRCAEDRHASPETALRRHQLAVEQHVELPESSFLDLDVYVGKLDAGERIAHRTTTDRGVWLHQIAGAIEVGGETLGPGDGAAIEDAEAIEITSASDAEFLLFDLRWQRWQDAPFGLSRPTHAVGREQPKADPAVCAAMRLRRSLPRD